MDFLSSVIGFVLAVGILVTVHEFGHFWVARVLGVKVLRFSVGLGKPLWSWRRTPDDTEYVVAMIPLGGYVRMLDESEGEVPESERERAFNRKPLRVRTAVVLAGPAFNFLFAILAYWLVFSIGVDGVKPVVGAVQPDSIAARAGFRADDTVLKIDGRRVQTWGEHRLYLMDRLLGGGAVEFLVSRADGSRDVLHLALGGHATRALSASGLEREIGIAPKLPRLQAVVGAVSTDSPASRAGFRAGDRIVAVDGVPVEDWAGLVQRVAPRAGDELAIMVERAQVVLLLTVTPEAVSTDGRVVGRIGIGPEFSEPSGEYLGTVRLGFGERIARAVEHTWLMSALTLKVLYRMLRLEVSTENLSGPLTIAHYAGQSVQIGVTPFLTFLAVISVSLGILNLLPIPILDGGHLLYYAIELFRGGPVPERVTYWGQQVGIVMLAGLMGLAFYNDIARLFG